MMLQYVLLFVFIIYYECTVDSVAVIATIIHYYDKLCSVSR